MCIFAPCSDKWVSSCASVETYILEDDCGALKNIIHKLIWDDWYECTVDEGARFSLVHHHYKIQCALTQHGFVEWTGQLSVDLSVFSTFSSCCCWTCWLNSWHTGWFHVQYVVMFRVCVIKTQNSHLLCQNWDVSASEGNELTHV